VETNKFEIMYSLEVKNDRNTIYKSGDPKTGLVPDDLEGFVLWYLNHKPTEQDMKTSFGFKPDFNGLAVFVFKHEKRWRILAIYSQGLNGLTIQTAVD